MKYGLKDNSHTRSVPHAPMCSCVDCMDATVTDNWSFTPDADSGISDRLVGDFESFAATRFSKEDQVNWVKVAEKGAYAEHDSPTHTDNEVHHSSMSREDFEEL